MTALTKEKSNYQPFLSSLSRKQWKKIGTHRRGGVATPLFSIYSKRSLGIGEIPDLKLLVDWCLKSGLSIIQLLPLNDVGFNFTPYDAISSFALDPMYLSLENICGVEKKRFSKDIEALKRKFPVEGTSVNYEVKRAKLQLLQRMFETIKGKTSPAFKKYVTKNGYWLGDYCSFKVLKEIHQEASWESWGQNYKVRDPEALSELEGKYSDRILFHAWLQWQLYEQMGNIKKYAASKKVLLMGDLPFLVARDSADVWAHQRYFKLDQVAGAPPDLYFAKGQRWGMPPYEWPSIEESEYDYVVEKLKYSENFFDLYRIDHVVGMFRLWTIRLSEPLESAGANGFFVPSDKSVWEEHGRKILSVMTLKTKMLPCAEDLGVVPECSNRVLEEFGIPGMDVQRWVRDWGKSYDFKSTDNYRYNSIAVTSTHDMAAIVEWWKNEISTVDRMRFQMECEKRNLDFNALREDLFDVLHSAPGRLRWKPEISNVQILLERLRLSYDEAYGIVDLYLASFDEKEKFLNLLGQQDEANKELLPQTIEKILAKCFEAKSVFAIPLMQDFLALEKDFFKKVSDGNFRINVPGTIGDSNWSMRLPYSMEKCLSSSCTGKIKKMVIQSTRLSKTKK